MQIGRGFLDVFEAIPDRIEVSGQEPTWRVTGGSFDSVVDYANEAFGEPTVVAREDRGRWWPRVTLTVTTDPTLVAEAPPLEALVDPEPELEPGADPVPDPAAELDPPAFADAYGQQPDPATGLDDRDGTGAVADESYAASALEEIFDHQEQLARARRRLPRQRRRTG